MKKIFCLILVFISLLGCAQTIEPVPVDSEVAIASNSSNYQNNEMVSKATVSNREDTGQEKVVVVEQQPDQIEFFDDDNGRGFIDPDGNKVLLSGKYDYFYDFYDGRMVVFNELSAEENKTISDLFVNIGVIDLYGNVIVDMGKYIASGRKGSDKYHYENGGLKITLGSQDANFYDGVIDVNGEYILEPIYSSISPEIVANRRAISIRDGASIKGGYLDEKFNVIIPLEYNLVFSFVDTNVGAYSIVLRTNTKIYPENSMELSEDYLFNYSIIDMDGNVLYEETDLIYCDFSAYQLFRANSLNMLLSGEEKDYSYVVLDKTTMEKKIINLSGLWTNNYDASFFQEDPQWLRKIEETEEFDVYVWDENTAYVVKTL